MMIELIILSFVLLVVCFFLGKYLGEQKVTTLKKDKFGLLSENEQLKIQISAMKQQLETERLSFEKTESMLKENIIQTKADMQDQQKQQESRWQTLHNQQEERWKEQMREQEGRWKNQQEELKNQFQSLAGEVLEKKSFNLQNVNKEQMDALLKPLKEKIEGLGKAVTDTNVASAANKASLEEIIKGFMDKADKIGTDAVNLTKALKGNTKMQGDWGEMILERMLEESGLKKDEEYYVQEDCLTEDGRHVRPDVIVRFPEKRSVVIDSKVSLTAYANYIAADDEIARQLALKEHILSIRKHIDELSDKDYSNAVKDTIGYVLMFIPNEASYIAAVQAEPDIINYAYRKRIIVISPTNLIMALQLAHNLWQTERQSRNVEDIIKRGSALYDKFVGFTDNFIKIGDNIAKTQKSYDDSYNQLARGSGNLTRQIDQLRSMGLNPSKTISSKIKDDADLVESETSE